MTAEMKSTSVRPQPCAHCGLVLPPNRLVVHDGRGGPSGAFCSGNGETCYQDARAASLEGAPVGGTGLGATVGAETANGAPRPLQGVFAGGSQ